MVESSTLRKLAGSLSFHLHARGPGEADTHNAELAKRETGVHALWLGFPLLFVSADDRANDQWILAPVFLWPISIDLDLRHEGRVRIGRYREPHTKELGDPQFNLALYTWVSQ